MYSIWNDCYENVESSIKTGRPICTPMTFNTSRCGLTEKFKIEELDALTSSYKDNMVFIEELAQYSDKYAINSKNIVITHKRKDNIYNDDVIYDDLMINAAAKELIRNKKNKIPGERILISNTEILLEFIEYIKSLAINPFSRPFLLNPLAVSVNSEDIIMMDRLMDGDVLDKNGKIIKKGLGSLLADYVFACDVYKQCIETEESTVDVSKDIDMLNNQINYHIRSDYRVLRNLVAWENRFLKTLIGMQLENKNSAESIALLQLIEEVKVQKQYRNGRVSPSTLEAFYRDKEFMCEECPYPSSVADNSELSEMYKHGGIEEVMNNFDLDEIYGSTQNYQEAVKLGIVKEKK